VEAYGARDESDSIAKWRRVFGDEFGCGVESECGFAAEAALPVVYDTSRFRDAVEAVKSVGRAILANVPTNFPWVQPAPLQERLLRLRP
jgi:hypothetical protein